MSLRTGTAARAVLRFGADLMAVAGGTEADIVRLDDAGTTIALRRGRLGVRLSAKTNWQRETTRGDVEITIPSGTLRLSAPGEYDIVAGEGKSPARLAVLAGEARFSGRRARYVVASGSAALLTGARSGHDAAGHDGSGSAEADPFVAWWRAQKRDPSMRRCFAMSPPRSPATRCSTSTAPGRASPVSARSGFRRTCRATGCRSATGTGAGSARGDGPGSTTGPGASRPRITAAGPISAAPTAEAGRWGWVPGRAPWQTPGERPGNDGDTPGFMPAAVAFLGTAGVGLSYPDAFSPAVAWFPLAPGEVYWPSFTDDPEAIRHLNAGAVADPAVIGQAAIGPAESARPEKPCRRPRS